MKWLLLSCLLGLIARTSLAQPASGRLATSSVVAARPDTPRIQALLAEGQRCLFKPGEKKPDLDSALSFTNQAAALSRRIGYPQGIQAAGLLTGNIYVEAKQWPMAWQVYSSLNDTGRIRLLFIMIRYRIHTTGSTRADFDSAETYLRLLPSLLSSTRDDGWSRADERTQRAAIDDLTLIPEAFNDEENPDTVAAVYLLASRLNQRLHQHDGRPEASLSILYFVQNRTKEALAAALDAIRIAETAPNPPADGFGYESAASIYCKMEDYAKSLEYFRKALAVFTQNPELLDEPGVLFSRTIMTYLKIHQPEQALGLIRMLRRHPPAFIERYMTSAFFAMSTADCYHALEQNDSAEYYYREALAHSSGSGPYNVRQKAIVWHRMAGFLTETRQYTRARRVLDSLAEAGTRVSLPATVRETAWLLRYQVDSALGDYRQSLTAIRRYQTLHDSLTNDTRNKQLAEMDVQYETEKKNQQLADLEKQNILQTSLRQAAIHQAQLVRNSFISGSILLVLFLVILFNRYRLRRRSNRLLNLVNTHQQQVLVQKEYLMREVHHRVKNSLQLVISLLDMQAYSLKDELALHAFDDMQARIQAISLIHQKLYGEDRDTTVINMRDYLAELVCGLEDSFSPGSRIRFHLDIEPIQLDVAQSVPVGLILNETITNAIKYAFPQSASPTNNDPLSVTPRSPEVTPTITITLHQTAGNIHLLIADNGIGLPPHLNPETAGSLGMQLIHTFTVQLEGRLTMENHNGLHIHISFPYQIPNPRSTIHEAAPA